MASRFLLNLRGGASAAARSARGRHLPAGRTWGPAMSPTTGALADAGTLAGRIPAVQGVRHYGSPFNRDTEVSRTVRNVKKRFAFPEEKSSVEEILKSLQRNHEKLEIPKGFRQLTNVAMVVGYSITFGVLVYHHVL